ncbi:hypothetical protein B0T26DRAFT_806983, partial [Lasiosphaeria miniovina]
MVRGLRGARSSGTSGMVHRAHGVDEAKLRSSKSSRKPKMPTMVPRKFQHSPRDKPSGGVAKPTWHHSQAAIQARCSANRPNRAAVRLHLLLFSQTAHPSIFLGLVFHSIISSANLPSLLIARQLSRKRPLEDSLQQISRVKKAKTSDEHHEVQTYLAAADEQSQRQVQRAAPASPSHPASPLLLVQSDLEKLQQEREIRPLLAPSVYSDGKVEYHFEQNANAVSELDTECGFVPAILGQCRRPQIGNISWNNTKSITEDQTVAPQPDLYYRFRIRDIHKSISDRIGPLIISETKGTPGAPYMIYETGGRHESLEVLKYQATHSAAATARAQLALKNFGLEEPVYDNE